MNIVSADEDHRPYRMSIVQFTLTFSFTNFFPPPTCPFPPPTAPGLLTNLILILILIYLYALRAFFFLRLYSVSPTNATNIPAATYTLGSGIAVT